MGRIALLQAELLRRGAAAAVIGSMENVRYLTAHYVWSGNSPLTFLLVPASGDPLLCVPDADASLARLNSAVPVEAYAAPSGFGSAAEVCRRALAARGVLGATLAFEYRALSVDRYELLRSRLDPQAVTDVGPFLAGLRAIKDPGETDALRHAASLVPAGVEEIARTLRAGTREAELKGTSDLAVYAKAVRRFPGAVVMSMTNVLTGPKLTRLHDAAGDGVVQAGVPVFVVAHVSWNGYWANTSRTLFTPGSAPGPEAARALEAITRAQRAAVARLTPGRRLADAVGAAEDSLATDGWAGRRMYSMVRGLGLTYAEWPGPHDLDAPIRPGMCLCVQLHLRLEDAIVGKADSVLVEEGGGRLLTEA